MAPKRPNKNNPPPLTRASGSGLTPPSTSTTGNQQSPPAGSAGDNEATLLPIVPTPQPATTLAAGSDLTAPSTSTAGNQLNPAAPTFTTAPPSSTVDAVQMMEMMSRLITEMGQQRAAAAPATVQVVHSPNEHISHLARLGFTNYVGKFDGTRAKTKGFLKSIKDFQANRGFADEVALTTFSYILDGAASRWWTECSDSMPTWSIALETLDRKYSLPRTVRSILEEASKYNTAGKSITQIVDDLTELTAPLVKATIDNVRAAALLHKLPQAVVSAMPNCDSLSLFELGEEAWRLAQHLGLTTVKGNSDPSPKDPKAYCNYCKKHGHTEKNCRSKPGNNSDNSKSKPDDSQKKSTNTDGKPAVEKSPRDKQFPNLPMRDNKYKCDNCDNVGWGTSMCPYCKARKNTANKPTSTTSMLQQPVTLPEEPIDEPDFGVLDASTEKKSNRPPPLVDCTIFTHPFTALVDTGATYCQGASQLYRHCVKHEIHLEEVHERLTMADGKPIEGKRYFAKVPVILGGRTLMSDFMIFPDLRTRMLLGDNFLVDHRIVINRPHGTWYFLDAPDKEFSFKFHGSTPKPQLSNLAVAIAPAPTLQEVRLRDDEGHGLTKEEKDKLNKVLEDHVQLFSMPEQPTPTLQHHIRLTGQCGRYRPLPRMSPVKTQKMRDLVEDLLNRGYIVPTEADQAVCPLLVEKPDGSARLCGDYRPLNQGTEDDVFPLPRIDDLINMGAKHKFCSLIDLQSGFWQVAIAPEDQNKTAFRTPFGLYKWTRMPFGLKNAPATFQRLMNEVFNGCIGHNCLVYIDDNLVMSETFEDHLRDLHEIFSRYKKHGLGLKRSKCSFIPQTVKFLGHVISYEGIKPSSDKVAAIKRATPPTNLKQLQSFLGLANWYRRHVKDFSKTVAPLTRLTRKDSTWNFGPECTAAFEQIKEDLSRAPLLQAPDYTQRFIVRTDASKYATGAVILQGETRDTERVIEYASRTLSDTETRYSTTERECLAVVWAITRWHFYLEGSRFTLITDHQALKWVLTTTSPNPRLANWANKIQSYMYDVEYKKGSENQVADALSRNPSSSHNVLEERPLVIELPRFAPRDLRQLQLEDGDLAKIIDDLEANDSEEALHNGFIMLEGVLHHEGHHSNDEQVVFVVPRTMVNDVIHRCHNAITAGHYGVEKTLQRIRNSFYWSTMRIDVTKYIASCHQCQIYKPSNAKPRGFLGQRPYADRWETLSIDIVGPLPISAGYKFILSVEDICTRWVEFFPIRNQSANTIATKLVNEIFFRYGLPKAIMSDNGTQLVSHIMEDVCSLLGIQHSLTPYYHPQANQVERVHRELKTRVAIYVANNHKKWATVLPAVSFALRTSVNSTTQQTPSFLMFGREMRSIADLLYDVTPARLEEIHPVLLPFINALKSALDESKVAQTEAKKQQKLQYDKLHQEEINFKVGDKVLIKSHTISSAIKGITAKLSPRREGPFEITKVLSPLTYELSHLNQGGIRGCYHVTDLTPYVEENTLAVLTAIHNDDFVISLINPYRSIDSSTEADGSSRKADDFDPKAATSPLQAGSHAHADADVTPADDVTLAATAAPRTAEKSHLEFIDLSLNIEVNNLSTTCDDSSTSSQKNTCVNLNKWNFHRPSLRWTNSGAPMLLTRLIEEGFQVQLVDTCPNQNLDNELFPIAYSKPEKGLGATKPIKAMETFHLQPKQNSKKPILKGVNSRPLEFTSCCKKGINTEPLDTAQHSVLGPPQVTTPAVITSSRENSTATLSLFTMDNLTTALTKEEDEALRNASALDRMMFNRIRQLELLIGQRFTEMDQRVDALARRLPEETRPIAAADDHGIPPSTTVTSIQRRPESTVNEATNTEPIVIGTVTSRSETDPVHLRIESNGHLLPGTAGIIAFPQTELDEISPSPLLFNEPSSTIAPAIVPNPTVTVSSSSSTGSALSTTECLPKDTAPSADAIRSVEDKVQLMKLCGLESTDEEDNDMNTASTDSPQSSIGKRELNVPHPPAITRQSSQQYRGYDPKAHAKAIGLKPAATVSKPEIEDYTKRIPTVPKKWQPKKKPLPVPPSSSSSSSKATTDAEDEPQVVFQELNTQPTVAISIDEFERATDAWDAESELRRPNIASLLATDTQPLLEDEEDSNGPRASTPVPTTKPSTDVGKRSRQSSRASTTPKKDDQPRSSEDQPGPLMTTRTTSRSPKRPKTSKSSTSSRGGYTSGERTPKRSQTARKSTRALSPYEKKLEQKRISNKEWRDKERELKQRLKDDNERLNATVRRLQRELDEKRDLKKKMGL